MNSFVRPLLTVLALAAAAPAVAAQPGRPPAGQPGAGQRQGGVLSGTVVDTEGKPLGSAQVAVWRAADSTLVTGVVTRGNGAFRVEDLPPGGYFVKVSAIGFGTTNSSAVTISPAQLAADVGTVRMAAGAVLLDAITVEGEQSEAAFSPDRNTYRTRDIPAASGGSAVDVLRNIPAVEVDQDGKPSLRGNQNVAVQINGRPTPMTGDQLAAFLQQLPASVVDNVQVIPNPSAKYDPEGMAGIINIVLKQNTDLGLSYGFVGGIGTEGRFNGSGNAGYQRGPLTLFGNYGIRHDKRFSRGFNDVSAFVDSSRQVLDFTSAQDVDGEFDMLSHMFNGSADLRLGSRDVVSSSLLLTRGSFDNEANNVYLQRDPGGSLQRRTVGLTETDSDDMTVDGSLSFKHTVTPQAHELSVETRFTRSENDFGNVFREYLGAADPSSLPLRTRQNTEAVTRNGILQADYTRGLGGRTRLETGYKGTLRLLDNNQRVASFDTLDGSWNSPLANTFEYDETVHAGYFVLSQGVGKFDVQGGLRAEYTDREFRLVEQDEAYPLDYLSWFPSGLVAWNVDPQRQVRLSYSRRIQRPDSRMLNPFSFSEDVRNRFTGNPNLEPEYTHSIDLALQQAFPTGSLQLAPFYQRTENAIRRIREVRADTLIATVQNLDTNEAYGLDVNASMRRSKLSGFASFSAFRSVTNAGSDSELSNDAIGWTIRGSATYMVTPRLDVTAFAFYRAPQEVEQGRMSSMTMSTLAIRQKLMGDRANIALRIVDPFDRMGFSMTTRDGQYVQLTERRFGGRAAYLTFTYNYGQQPRLRTPQPQPEEPQQPGSVVGP